MIPLPLPYRAKNPPEHFPYCTIGLIAINTLIFGLTSNYFLSIKMDALKGFALSHETFSFWRMITSIFLHANLLHLAGNMLFLWIFGASVEGRLRPPKFLVTYFVAGLTGSILMDMVWGVAHPTRFGLGASGAIMGLAGAYLYLFPYSLICVYFRWVLMEWQARWVVLLYVGSDLLSQLLFAGGDGVGHMAHLGGFGSGFLCVFLMRARRDSEEHSQVQATHADTKDYSLLSLNELETLTRQPTDDMNLVMTYCEKCVTTFGDPRYESCLAMIQRYSHLLYEKAEPGRLAQVLLYIPVSVGGMPPVFYLRLASRLEKLYSNDLASQLYRRIYDLNPTAPEAEVALFRYGQIMENAFQNRAHAHAAYNEMLRLFPNGEMALEARRALQHA